MPPKKAIKKVSKKEDSDDEYVDDDVELDEINEVEDDVEDFDEEDDEDEDNDEKDELNIDPDTEIAGCAIEEAIEDDDEYFDNNDETELQVEQQSAEYVSKENRVSSNRLTKYEMVRILGERCKQLTMGAKPLIKNYKDLSYDRIAEEEFKRNMIPFKIKRPLPNGKFEIWTLDELTKDHLLAQIE
jgi:DNA-directed RNA polymerase subunit K/omega